MSNWRQWLHTHQYGSKREIDEVSERLTNVVKIKQNISGKKRENVDVIKTSKLVHKSRENSLQHIEQVYKNADVSLSELIKVIGQVRSDRSVKALVELIERSAVDEKAKEYWRTYMGDYGRLLTRDFQEVMDNSKIKISRLLGWKQWLARNYGVKSSGVQVLNSIVGKGGISK